MARSLLESSMDCLMLLFVAFFPNPIITVSKSLASVLQKLLVRVPFPKGSRNRLYKGQFIKGDRCLPHFLVFFLSPFGAFILTRHIHFGLPFFHTTAILVGSCPSSRHIGGYEWIKPIIWAMNNAKGFDCATLAKMRRSLPIYADIDHNSYI